MINLNIINFKLMGRIHQKSKNLTRNQKSLLLRKPKVFKIINIFILLFSGPNILIHFLPPLKTITYFNETIQVQ